MSFWMSFKGSFPNSMAHSKITKNIRNSCGGAWNSERRIAQYYCKLTPLFFGSHPFGIPQVPGGPSDVNVANDVGLYPLVNIQKNYGKSPFLMGKLTINCHFQ